MTDTSDLRNRLALWSSLVGRETSDGVRQFAQVACVNLSHNTQPYGNQKGDKEIGEKAVEVDINKVFYTPQDGGFANAIKDIVANSNRSDVSKAKFYSRLDGYIQSNNLAAITRIARSFSWRGLLFDDVDPGLHKSARRPPRGRVNKKRGSMYMIIGGSEPLAKYKEQVKKKVGLTKAGWAKCAKLIPVKRVSSATRGIPQWVTRHLNRASGSIVDNSNTTDDPHIKMTNGTPWTSEVCGQSAQRDALGIAKGKFVNYMNQQIKYELRKQAGLQGR